MTNGQLLEILKTLPPTGKVVVRFDCGEAGKLAFNVQLACSEDYYPANSVVTNGLTVLTVYGAPPNATNDPNSGDIDG